MTDCLQRLDEIILIAEKEYSALLSGDISLAEVMCAKRSSLLPEIIDKAKMQPDVATYDKLMFLQDIQQKLMDEAAKQREELRKQLLHTKKETKRMQAYHHSQILAL